MTRCKPLNMTKLRKAALSNGIKASSIDMMVNETSALCTKVFALLLHLQVLRAKNQQRGRRRGSTSAWKALIAATSLGTGTGTHRVMNPLTAPV